MRSIIIPIIASLAAASPARAGAPVASPEKFRINVASTIVRRDSLRIARALAEAERFAAAGRTADARRAARIAIGEQESDGESTAASYWLIATAHYADGDDVAAARALDRAAESAVEFADPTTELRSTFEAAVLYSRHHMPQEVLARIARVRRLLKSPAIAEDVKRSIERRIASR